MLSAEKVILIDKNYTWPTIDKSFYVSDNFDLTNYSVNIDLWGTRRSYYEIPDDMLDIIKNYDIYNTVELGVTVYENLAQITLFATIGDDGGSLLMMILIPMAIIIMTCSGLIPPVQLSKTLYL